MEVSRKVQSDDPQLPDLLCNTFTKAREEGESHPPFIVPWLYTPLSPHSLEGWNEHSGLERSRSSLSPLAAGLQLAKFLAHPWLWQQVQRCSNFPPASPSHSLSPTASGKSQGHMHIVSKLQSWGCLFQRWEWSCLEGKTESGEEKKEMNRKKSCLWFFFRVSAKGLGAVGGAGYQGSFSKHLCSLGLQLLKTSWMFSGHWILEKKQSDEQKWSSSLKRAFRSLPLPWREWRCC